MEPLRYEGQPNAIDGGSGEPSAHLMKRIESGYR